MVGVMMPHYEASLVEIVRIFVEDTAFSLGVSYECELLENNVYIFAFDYLVVVHTRKTRTKL